MRKKSIANTKENNILNPRAISVWNTLLSLSFFIPLKNIRKAESEITAKPATSRIEILGGIIKGKSLSVRKRAAQVINVSKTRKI